MRHKTRENVLYKDFLKNIFYEVISRMKIDSHILVVPGILWGKSVIPSHKFIFLL